MFFLSFIKATVNKREKLLCQQAKNNHTFPEFLFQIQMKITCAL